MKHKVYTDFWKKIGTTDPYFGVLTHPEYRSNQLDDAAKEAFYQSGEEHIENSLKIFRKIWPNANFSTASALDFGCGTGRLSLALSKHFDEVVGVDVSAGMLAQANESKQAKGITNVTFKEVSGTAPFLDQKYDYIHTAMVFQHIHPDAGMPILDHLLAHLNTGGSAFLHLTYHNLSTQKHQRRNYFNFTFPFIGKWLGRNTDYAFPMFDYDLNEVFALLQKHGIRRLHQVFGASGNHQFVKLYVRKKL
jgi:cyclopropane fatty-acyl-phospholipid synthase-like methyltransferase